MAKTLSRRDLAAFRQRRFDRFRPDGASVDPLKNPQGATAPERSKRSFLLLALTLLIPGSAQALAGNRSLGRFAMGVTVSLWALLILVILGALFARDMMVVLASYPTAQFLAVIFLAVLAVGWAILWIDTFRLIRFRLLAPGLKPIVAFTTVILMVLTSGSLAYGSVMLNSSRTSLSTIFADSPPIDPVNGRYNFLVMGGDAGEGRQGLRPDSISVASVNADTGKIILFSIPRNFQNTQFSDDSPLWSVYPNGYDCGDQCIINSLYVDVVNDHSDLYPGAEDPGAEAMMDAASGILGIDVQAYVLLDMEGFAQLIDSMGGVTVTTGGWTTHRGNRPDGEWGNAWWGPGTYEFDGKDALAFARSRHWSSDYSRIRRQQCIQQAMLSQFNLPTLLTRFEGILDAGEQIVETDLPQQQLGTFLSLGAKSQQVPMDRLTIGAPDFGDQGERFSTYPDFDEIHSRVSDMLAADDTPLGGSTPAGVNIAPLLTHFAQVRMDVEGDEATGSERGSAASQDPADWPEPPTQADGTEITEEYLMWAEDTYQEALLEDASSTNQYCHPG